jgi:hypothetical protein
VPFQQLLRSFGDDTCSIRTRILQSFDWGASREVAQAAEAATGFYYFRPLVPNVSGVLERMRGWLFGPETPVLLAAIVVALPTAYSVQHWLDSGFEASFLVLMMLGVGVPQLYDRWPHQYEPPLAVVWALAACAVVTAVFVAVYLVAYGLGAGTPIAAIVALLLADLGTLALIRLWTGTAMSE